MALTNFQEMFDTISNNYISLTHHLTFAIDDCFRKIDELKNENEYTIKFEKGCNCFGTTKLTNEFGHISGYKQTKNIGIIVELLNTNNEIINVSYKMLYMNTDEKFSFLEQLVKEINKLEELNNTLQKEEDYE